MTETVADHVLARLREWDVDQVFAYPGDGINGLVAAFDAAKNKPRFVQARHEEMAAFQAVGYAKFSGRPGSADRFPARWPRWVPPFRTPSARSSPAPTVR
jgi:thiamine pyrophosphate-dependent acetolactate synthase large subunit-like protein